MHKIPHTIMSIFQIDLSVVLSISLMWMCRRCIWSSVDLLSFCEKDIYISNVANWHHMDHLKRELPLKFLCIKLKCFIWKVFWRAGISKEIFCEALKLCKSSVQIKMWWCFVCHSGNESMQLLLCFVKYKSFLDEFNHRSICCFQIRTTNRYCNKITIQWLTYQYSKLTIEDDSTAADEEAVNVTRQWRRMFRT